MSEKPVNKETERIKAVYASRDASGLLNLYAWHLPNAKYFEAIKTRMFATALSTTIGNNLSEVRLLDIGCGSGTFIRQMIEWGATPDNLMGTEILADRLQLAMKKSPKGVTWHLGELDFDADDRFDLVSAHTVFSSILDDKERLNLATQMWKKVRPGGWLMIFDFRYNNPGNPNVRKLTRKEMQQWWPSSKSFYRTGLLAPPLARRIVCNNYLFAEALTYFIPLLRTHFVYMACK